MSSSLASQLKKVRSHNAARLTGGKSAQRIQSKSYLFPPSVASLQDYQTLHGLALNGWNELCLEDSTFTRWNDATGSADLLFGDSSKDLDRLTKTKEENAAIDQAILEFLYLIGDKMLDRSSAKCLEWLIRRFRAHEYNVQMILSAFIPYHESVEFARMLSILELKDKPQFAFLLPVQKSTIPLPSSVLMSTLLAPPSTTSSLVTLRWIMGLVKAPNFSAKSHTFQRNRHTVLSFWLSTIVKLCSLWSGSDDINIRMGLTKNNNKNRETRDDDAQSLLTILLPAILEFMAIARAEVESKESSVYGSMAICAIANAFELSIEAGSGIIASLASTSSKKNNGNTALLIACACVTQQITKNFVSTQPIDGLNNVPRMIKADSARKLARLIVTDESFKKDGQSYDLDSFFYQLTLGLTDAVLQGGGDIDIVKNALDSIFNQDKVMVNKTAIKAITYMISNTDTNSSSILLEVISRIRQRYPQIFESAFRAASKSSNVESRSKLDSLMGSILALQAGSSNKSSNDDDDHSILWLGMQDADSSSRINSLRKLLKLIKENSIKADDKFAQDLLASTLSDDSIEVLNLAYQESDILIQSLTVKRIIDEVCKVLEHSDKENKIPRSIVASHVQFLMQKLIKGGIATEEEQWRIWTTIIWPKLLLVKRSRKTSQAFYTAISETFSAENGKSLTKLSSRLKDISNSVLKHVEDPSLSKANEVLVETVAKHVVLKDQSEIDFILNSAFPARQTEPNPHSQILALLTLSSLLQSESLQQSEQFCGKIVSMLKDQGDRLGNFRENEGQSVFDSIYSKPSSEKTKGKVYSTLFFSLAKSMPILRAKYLEQNNLGDTWEGPSDYVPAFFEFIIMHLMHELNLTNSVLEILLQRMQHESLEFLASIWTRSNNAEQSMAPELRLMALRYAHAYLYAQIKSSKAIDFQTIIPAFLIALNDNEKNIRLEGIASLQALQTLAIKFTSNSNVSEAESIYGYDAIYGPQTADSLTYLDSTDALNFLKNIVDARQSFINEPTYLASWMSSNLTLQAKEDGKKLSAYKGAIIHYLSSHVLCWQNSYARLSLLKSMSGVSSERKLSTLLPLVEKSMQDSSTSPALVASLMNLYDKSVKSTVKSDTQGAWTLFKTALGGTTREVQICAASVLQNQLFTILSREKQREIILFLADLITNSSIPMPKEIRQCLYSLPIQSDLITNVLSELRKDITDSLLSRDQPVNKRTRIDVAEQQQESKGIQLLGNFIEMLEATLSRKPSPSSALLAELFDCLRLGIDLHLSNISTSAEHIMQIAMSNLTAACSSMDSAMTTEVLEPMRIDTLINVVKTPCRPYTFQQALSLLSLIGKLSPDLLLHHSMPIFTFVGSTMMQRDDEHSFTVIERTLESILPPVVADIRNKQQLQKPQQKSNLSNIRDQSLPLLQSARPLLCVFTDAATHVPRHRRQNFFHLLANVMGVDDFLAPICLLLIDRQAYKVAKQLTDDEAASALQLPLSLFERAQDSKKRKEAAIDIHLGVLNEVWNEAMRTWQYRSEDPIEMQEHVFLDCVRHIDSEHESRKMDPIKRIVALLRFAKFAILDNRTTLSEEREDETEQERNKRDSILHTIIQHALTLTRVDSKSISTASQEALDEVMTIVSVSTLKHVVNTLVESKDGLSKRSGLLIFASAVGVMTEGEREQASGLVPNVIKTCSNMFTTSMEDKIVALDTLSAICEQPQSNEHFALSDIISNLAKLAIQSAQKKQSQVTERALDVLRKLSEMLGPRLIPKLVELVNVCEKIIERIDLPKGEDEQHQQQGALNVLVALTRSVPTFMSTHLKSLFELFIRSSSTTTNKNGEKKLLANIVKFVNVNEVLQAAYDIHKSSSSNDLVKVNLFCLDVVQSCTRSMDKRKTVQHYKAIFRFLLDCFDLRRKNITDLNKALSIESLAEIESKTVGVFVRLVFRLNEATFRPLFLRLCDWALVDLAEEEEEESKNNTVQDQIYARQTVLYKVLNALMEELGELISHYYVNVLDATIDTLNNGKVLEKTLWEPMLTSVKLSSKVDKGTFWNQVRARKMLNALIAQLNVPSSPILSSSTMERLLSDSICSLCVTVSDEICLKGANNSLLDIARQLNSAATKLFSSSNEEFTNSIEQQKVRIISVQILEKLWRTKGLEDNLLALVPETVPSIAELLQSGDEEMQQVMTGLVSAIEEILGEGLDAYLQ